MLDLPITFPTQSQSVINYFNDIANTDDLASVPETLVHLLPLIEVGQKAVSFSSWAKAKTVIPSIASKTDWILYNPEHWTNTPINEQNNLVLTIKNAASFTHKYGLRLLVVPDRKFVDEVLPGIAKYADAIFLQGQRIQDTPATFEAWMTEKIAIARRAKPRLIIYSQVGAVDTEPEEMLTAIETIEDKINGIAIWSTPRSLDTLQGFIDLIR